MAPELLWAGTAMAAAHGITNRVDIYRCVRACVRACVRGVGGSTHLKQLMVPSLRRKSWCWFKLAALKTL
jgi:hypothetical protein